MNEDDPSNGSFMPRYFLIWFLLSEVLLIVGGLIDLSTGQADQASQPIGAAVAIAIMTSLSYGVWKGRNRVQALVQRIPLPTPLLSILLGWLFAEIDEIVSYLLGNPLTPGISMVEDILFTTPIYILAHYSWYQMLKRYRFSHFQAMATGGIALGFFEVVLGGASPLAVVIIPFLIMIHGVHMVIPAIALEPRLREMQRGEGVNYVVSIGSVVLGTGVGVLLSLILASP